MSGFRRDEALQSIRAVASLWRDPDTLARYHKRALLMCIDVVIILLCAPVALLLSAQTSSLMTVAEFWVAQLVFAGAAVCAFQYFGLYRAITRFITGKAMPIIMTGTALGMAAGALVSALFGVNPGLGTTLTQGLLVLLAVASIRFGLRSLLRRPIQRNCAPVIIFGAGNAGQQLVAALHLGLEYRPVAFVDDAAPLHGATINGVRVYPPAELKNLIEQFKCREVLLAMPSINRMRRRRIVSRLESLEVKVKTIPGMGDIVAGRARYTDLRPVTPEDLLGRDPVPPDPALMRRNITGKVVMVTGAGGSIGAELCRQILAQEPKRLVLLDISEYALYTIATQLRDRFGAHDDRLVPLLGSVQDAERVRAIMARFHVQTIYHAAAYKHVGMVEENLIEGLVNNVFGTRTLADVAVSQGVENFILISSDKTVRPTNVMGASKRLAELICQANAAAQAQRPSNRRTTFSMVRFGNVLGSSGSVIPRFRDQIERGGPVTVTHPEVTRYFMTLTEAAQLVIQAGAMARGGDVFVLDMGMPVRILDLAKSMIRQHGLTPYMVDDDDQPVAEGGDIPVKITGLKPGEKLYEELLIGDNPSGSAHPRIMTASEIAMSSEELTSLLDVMHAACARFDFPFLHQLLLNAPLAYSPATDEINDLTWRVTHERRAAATASLRVVT